MGDSWSTFGQSDGPTQYPVTIASGRLFGTSLTETFTNTLTNTLYVIEGIDATSQSTLADIITANITVSGVVSWLDQATIPTSGQRYYSYRGRLLLPFGQTFVASMNASHDTELDITVWGRHITAGPPSI